MQRSRSGTPLAIVGTFVPVLLLAGAGEGSRCSLAPFPHARSARTTYLLGTAALDTVLTGPGRTEPSAGPGHWGDGRERPIYGQVITIDRLGGADSTTLAADFAQRGAGTVIIVPWDYDPQCRPTPWSGSARWVPPGEQGMFTVKLRAAADWAAGVPTFDAFMADTQPYPLGVFFQDVDELRNSASLSAAEYFAFFRALPDPDTAPADALSAIAEWEKANPELARKYPATVILEEIRRNVYHGRALRILRSIVPPVGGTYRLRFELAGRGEQTFYARTRPMPTTEWTAKGSYHVDPRTEPPHPEGYYLLTSGALSLDSLPSDCTAGRQAWREGYIAILDPLPATGEVRREWLGKIEPGLLAAQFPADSALRRFEREQFDQFTRRPEGTRDTPARFTLGADGIIRVAQAITLPDGRTLKLDGERMSTATIACSW